MLKKIIYILFFIIIVAMIYIGFRESWFLGYLILQYKIFIKSYGLYAPVVYMCCFILSTIIIFPPLAFFIYTFLSGLLFGFIPGIIYSLIAFNIGAACSFLIARYFASSAVLNFLTIKIDNILTKADHDRWHIVALLRLVPVIPNNLQNYLFGFTKINFTVYCFITGIFLLPRIIVNNYIGAKGEVFLLHKGILESDEWFMVLGMVIALVLGMWLAIRLYRHKYGGQMPKF